MAINNGQLTIMGATKVVLMYPSVKVCRERPMCRSAAFRTYPVSIKQNHPPIMSFRANAVSRGIHPSSKFYLVVVHYPTWWIPPLRLRCGRNDISGERIWFLLETVPSFHVRAADCRPYNTFVPKYRVFNVSTMVLCSKKCKRRCTLT